MQTRCGGVFACYERHMPQAPNKNKSNPRFRRPMRLRPRLPCQPACERCARPAPGCLTRVGLSMLSQVLARFAWHEAELPFSEADGLRMMIFELGCARTHHTQSLTPGRKGCRVRVER